MKVELYHGSKYGNGTRVAEEIKRLMMAKGHEVNIHHISDADPRDVPPADLYIFGSPTHFGKAPGNVMRWMKKLALPPQARYALFITCSAARPDKKSGKVPTEEELERMRSTGPMIDEQLQGKGLTKVAEGVIYVQPESLKGPLESGWEQRVATFVSSL